MMQLTLTPTIRYSTTRGSTRRDTRQLRCHIHVAILLFITSIDVCCTIKQVTTSRGWKTAPVLSIPPVLVMFQRPQNFLSWEPSYFPHHFLGKGTFASSPLCIDENPENKCRRVRHSMDHARRGKCVASDCCFSAET